MNEILFILSILFYLGGVLFAYKVFGKVGLYIWTAISAILANIEALKMVDMFGLSVTLGNALYASSFVVTDILSENHDKESANKAVNIGLFVTVIWVLATQLILMFEPNSLDFINGSLIEIFGLMPRIAIASIFTYAVVQKIDVILYHKVWEKTNKIFKNSNKGLWLRNNISTLTSQFLDTLTFTLIAFAGTMPFKELISLVLTTYILKAVVSILDTPIIYIAKKMKNKETIIKSEEAF